MPTCATCDHCHCCTRQAECAEHPTLWDQNLFKDVLKIGGLKFKKAEGVPAVHQQKRLFLGYDATALEAATAEHACDCRCAAALCAPHRASDLRLAGRRC